VRYSRVILIGASIAALGFAALAADIYDYDFNDKVMANIGYAAEGRSDRPRKLTVVAKKTGFGRNRQVFLMSKDIVEHVAGTIFVETAYPSPRLEKDCPTLSYQTALPFGRRLVAGFSHEKGSLEVADWEIKPLIQFVKSGLDAIISKANADADSDQSGIREVKVHPAFKDTLSGLVLLLSDSIFSDVSDPVGFTSLFSKSKIPGFNRNLDGSALSGYDKTQARDLREFIRIEIESAGANQLMFTDWRQDFTADRDFTLRRLRLFGRRDKLKADRSKEA
jgi:hypothetical protein